VVERLLSISGEDTITVNRKYRDQCTGKLPSRFMIISNEQGDPGADAVRGLQDLVRGQRPQDLLAAARDQVPRCLVYLCAGRSGALRSRALGAAGVRFDSAASGTTAPAGPGLDGMTACLGGWVHLVS